MTFNKAIHLGMASVALSGPRLDSAKTGSGGALSNGELTLTQNTASAWGASVANVGSSSGLRIFQFTVVNNTSPGYVAGGICNSSYDFTQTSGLGTDNNSIGYNSLGQVVMDSTVVATYDSFAAGDTISICETLFAPLMLFVKVNSGNWNANPAADPATSTGGLTNVTTLGAAPHFPLVGCYDTGRAVTVNLAGPFSPAAPSGATAYGT